MAYHCNQILTPKVNDYIFTFFLSQRPLPSRMGYTLQMCGKCIPPQNQCIYIPYKTACEHMFKQTHM